MLEGGEGTCCQLLKSLTKNLWPYFAGQAPNEGIDIANMDNAKVAQLMKRDPKFINRLIAVSNGNDNLGTPWLHISLT